jgi:hypothetical protein
LSTETIKDVFEEYLEKPGEPKKAATVPRSTRVRREGDAIIIPEAISYAAAAKACAALAEQDEEEYNRIERFTCHPNDGYIAVTKTIEDAFGPVAAKGKEMFGMKLSVPEVKRIKTGLGILDYVEAFSDGDIAIPTLPGVVINVAGSEDNMMFGVRVTAKKKHTRAVNAFLDEVGRRIREESIYKGKAFDSKFNFLDLSTANEDKLVLPDAAATQVQANVFAPLKWKNALRKLGTSFGRSVLLEGPYGCGKTLAAFVAGSLAVANGITFIYIRAEDADKLPLFMRYARQYASGGDGAVVFYEDIDLLMGSNDSERTDDVNLVLNTLDGIDAKSGSAQDVMLVLTSNNAESINEALMRPGRIDAVIHIDAPDAAAAARLLAMYGGDLLDRQFDFEKAGLACQGMTPAFIREVVDRSKLVALARTEGSTNFSLIASDIISAAQGIAKHIELASPRTAKHTTGDRLASAFREVVDGVVRPHAAALAEATGYGGYNNWSHTSSKFEEKAPNEPQAIAPREPTPVSLNGSTTH